MTIGEIAMRSGMAPSAIRYYEKTGLLVAAARASGKRVYDVDVLHELAIIRFAKDTGFALPEIKRLLREFPEMTPASVRWKQMARAKIRDLERALTDMLAVKVMLENVMSCHCTTLAQCVRATSPIVRTGGTSQKDGNQNRRDRVAVNALRKPGKSLKRKFF
jgi:MerR family redox-sensitive transcriptional activator SoxR